MIICFSCFSNRSFVPWASSTRCGSFRLVLKVQRTSGNNTIDPSLVFGQIGFFSDDISGTQSPVGIFSLFINSSVLEWKEPPTLSEAVYKDRRPRFSDKSFFSVVETFLFLTRTVFLCYGRVCVKFIGRPCFHISRRPISKSHIACKHHWQTFWMWLICQTHEFVFLVSDATAPVIRPCWARVNQLVHGEIRPRYYQCRL